MNGERPGVLVSGKQHLKRTEIERSLSQFSLDELKGQWLGDGH